MWHKIRERISRRGLRSIPKRKWTFIKYLLRVRRAPKTINSRQASSHGSSSNTATLFSPHHTLLVTEGLNLHAPHTGASDWPTKNAWGQDGSQRKSGTTLRATNPDLVRDCVRTDTKKYFSLRPFENASHVRNALALTKRNNIKRPEILLRWSVWIKITLKIV